MKTHNDNLNRLKAFTPLLQTLLSEFQEEINHLLEEDDKNLISDNEVFRRLLERRTSRYKTLSNRRISSHNKIKNRSKSPISRFYVRPKYYNEEKVIIFFKKNKELIDCVFSKEKGDKTQTYYIALKEDCTKNRNIVFDFLEKYEEETQHSFLVQFIPLSFVNKFNHLPKINLD
ncbi:hypothetical protein ACE193_15055 [Bernardetia sp. OM2101]|uniref:hypothetical protein n=1 Tax=Bernardetia sp. OM2101 TaxID=3344876 RepID=UPI0035CEF2AF